MDKDEIAKVVASSRADLLARGVEHIALFGSRARGDARADSDVDLLIDVAPDRKFSLIDLVGVERIVGDALRTHVGIVLRRSASPALMETIRPELILIF